MATSPSLRRAARGLCGESDRWRDVRPLLWFAAASTALAMVYALALAVDPRVLDGTPLWVKPLKFAVANATFAATLGWMLTHLRGRRRLARRLATIVAWLLVLENALIGVQAGRGVHSHFNAGTPVDAVVVSLMGLAIALVMACVAGIGIALARQRDGDPVLRTSMLWALAITLAGSAIGGMMSVPRAEQVARLRESRAGAVLGGHTVGAPDGGPYLPVVYWSGTHGDLRVAHFLGLHALQVIPLFGWLVSRRRLPTRRQIQLVRGASVGYASLTALLAWQALRGESIAQLGETARLVVAACALGIASVVLWSLVDRAASRTTRGRRARVSLGLLLVAALPAALAQSTIHRPSPAEIDLAMQSIMRGLRGTAAIEVVSVATHVGGMPGSLALAAVLGALLLLARRWREGLGLVGLVLAIGTMLRVVKPIIARERPLGPLVVETGYSFPSGHALATVVPLVTGLGRLLLSVHWLTDVIAGWSIGAGLVLLTVVAVDRARVTRISNDLEPGSPLTPARPGLPPASARGRLRRAPSRPTMS
ncbi:MAG TPA: hypothetical protein VGE02_01200 [Gemmatimonadales bacterium]